MAYMAKKTFGTDLKIIGTVAHSFITNIAALYGPIEANSIAMKLWRDNFNGNLGIFLPDSFGWKAFSDIGIGFLNFQLRLHIHSY